jgi:hypothetical protein
VTTLTVKVDVLVVVVLMAVLAEAEFVAHTVAAVLDDMDQMVLAEERQGTEHPRLVNRQNLVFQLR